MRRDVPRAIAPVRPRRQSLPWSRAAAARGDTATDSECPVLAPHRTMVAAVVPNRVGHPSIQRDVVRIPALRSTEDPRSNIFLIGHKKIPPSFDEEGWLSCDPVSLPNRPHPLLRDPPCPGRQVGEGVSPTLDARANMADFFFRVERSLTVQLVTPLAQ
jgi:hypothetical protein